MRIYMRIYMSRKFQLSFCANSGQHMKSSIIDNDSFIPITSFI